MSHLPFFLRNIKRKKKTKHQEVTKSLSQWGGFTCYCDLLGPARTSDGGHSPGGTVVSASGLASAYLSGIISSGTLLDSLVLISCCRFLLHTTRPISLVPGSSLDQLCLCMFQNSMFPHQVVSITPFLPHWLVLIVWRACCNSAVAAVSVHVPELHVSSPGSLNHTVSPTLVGSNSLACLL